MWGKHSEDWAARAVEQAGGGDAGPALGGLTILGHVPDGHAVLLGHVPQEGEDHEAGGEARQGIDGGGDDRVSGE